MIRYIYNCVDMCLRSCMVLSRCRYLLVVWLNTAFASWFTIETPPYSWASTNHVLMSHLILWLCGWSQHRLDAPSLVLVAYILHTTKMADEWSITSRATINPFLMILVSVIINDSCIYNLWLILKSKRVTVSYLTLPSSILTITHRHWPLLIVPLPTIYYLSLTSSYHH